MQEECQRIITLHQVGPTCWFNALLMGMFYSHGMRNLMSTKMGTWTSEQSLLSMFYNTVKDIIINKHKVQSNRVVDLKAFREIYPEHILKTLHAIDPHNFYMDPAVHERGIWPFAYLSSLFKILNIHASTNYLDFDLTPKQTAFSAKRSVMLGLDIANVEHDQGKYYVEYVKQPSELLDAPEVIVINCLSAGHRSGRYNVFYPKHMRGVLDFDEGTLTYNKQTYVIDGLYLINFKSLNCSRRHAIAGITCNNQRYVYNGWTPKTYDPAMPVRTKKDAFNRDKLSPCDLMKHDWLRTVNDFCLNPRSCSLDPILSPQERTRTMCFNFHKGSRFYMAVRKDIYDMRFRPEPMQIEHTMFSRVQKHKRCPSKYHRHPVTLDCVKCPPGMELYRKINRSVDDRGKKHPPEDIIREIPLYQEKSEKQCPEGKVVNQATGRCIKERIPKECPPGKVLNPKTKRCKTIV